VTYLLDTCAVSELIRMRPDGGLVSWIQNTEEELLHLSVLTIGELEKGIAKLGDARRKSRLEMWVRADLAERFRGRLLGIDAAIATRWGRLNGESEQRGQSLPLIDSLLTATAMHHDLSVVTRNTMDFERCGARCINPWTG
jgi:toxin FitB